MSYAIIRVGSRQYRVQEGERLLVDRLPSEEGATFSPEVLLVDGDLDANGRTVTARVLGHVLGEKIRIGKYKAKKGYKKHTGYRSRLSQIVIESIGDGAKAAPAKAATATAEEPAAEKPKGMPKGYEELTVAQIAEAAPGWRRPQLEAALEYERGNAARKGAISALESALAAKETD